MRSKVPFIKPDFPSAIEMIGDYEEIVRSNWYTNFGPFEKKLSAAVATYVGQGTIATTVANATLGLDIAIRSLFLKKTHALNEVIMPSFTFAAGAEVLIANGYRPVFIDVDDSTWQPNIIQAKQYIEKNESSICGILLCNIFGVGNSQIAKWEKLAAEYTLPLIIDTAAGFGSMYGDINKPVGARGDCEVFSMHATKPFCVGEGGLILSRNPDIIEKCRYLQNFGFIDYKIEGIGTNAKLQEFNCAIGCRQLTRLDEHLERRRWVLQSYKEQFSNEEFEYQQDDHISTVPFFSLVSKTSTDAEVIKKGLKKDNIDVRSYYTPLHLSLYLQPLTTIADTLHTTESIASRIISLPVHDDMSIDTIRRITKTVINQLARAKK